MSNVLSFCCHFSPDLSDEDPDVLLAVEAECRGCYVTKKHARTLDRIKIRRRKIDLKIGFEQEREQERCAKSADDVEEEDRLVDEILKVYAKRKKLRRKADVEDEVGILLR